jgi:uncharacterized membrane protein (UPF0127 family)
MRFPIDVAFVRRDGRIVKAVANLRAWRLAASFRAFAVVELPAGVLAATDTGAGDELRLSASQVANPQSASQVANPQSAS